MEILDVVNNKDQVIGTATRSEVYEKKLPHRIAHVLLFNDENKIALQLRSNKVKFCPNHWSTSVGGHVLTGETYEEAAKREFKEELGVENPITFISKDEFKSDSGMNKFLTVYKSKYNGPFKVDLDEVEKAEFFSKDEVKNMIANGEKFHPELLFLLQKHFQ